MADMREAAAVLQEKISDLHRLRDNAERDLEEERKHVTWAENKVGKLKSMIESLEETREFLRMSNYDTEYWKG